MGQRVLVAEFMHETNTFTVQLTGEEAFRNAGCYFGNEIDAAYRGTHNGQATDLAQFTSLGVDPTRKSTLIVKSMQHFRAAFEPIAREVLEVDTGALSTRNFKERPYKNVRGPIWPLDDI